MEPDEIGFRNFLQSKMPAYEPNADATLFTGVVPHNGEVIHVMGGATPKWYWGHFVTFTLQAMMDFIDCFLAARAAGGFTCPADVNPVTKTLWEVGFYKNEALEAYATHLSTVYTGPGAGVISVNALLQKGAIASLRIFPQG